MLTDDCLLMLSVEGEENSDFLFMAAKSTVQAMRVRFNSGWSKSDRAGWYPFWQAAKKATENFTVAGFFLTALHEKSLSSMETLENLLKKQKPLLMLSSTGEVLDKWIMKSLEYNKTVFMRDGTPLKVDFTMDLEGYYD